MKEWVDEQPMNKGEEHCDGSAAGFAQMLSRKMSKEQTDLFFEFSKKKILRHDTNKTGD